MIARLARGIIVVHGSFTEALFERTTRESRVDRTILGCPFATFSWPVPWRLLVLALHVRDAARASAAIQARLAPINYRQP